MPINFDSWLHRPTSTSTSTVSYEYNYSYGRKEIKDKMATFKLEVEEAVPEVSNVKDKVTPKKEETSEFVGALLKEPTLAGLTSIKTAFVLSGGCKYHKELRQRFKKGHFTEIYRDVERLGGYFNHFNGVGLMFLLVDVANFFPSMMELALLLKESYTTSIKQYILIKGMSEKSVDDIVRERDGKKSGDIYLIKDPLFGEMPIRNLTKEQLIETAYFAGLKKQMELKVLDKLDAPCIVVTK